MPFQHQIEKNILIINIIKDKTYVHSVVYNEWLNSGGSVEILLGNMLSNNRITYGKLLLDNAQSLINKWNSYYAIEKQARTKISKIPGNVVAQSMASDDVGGITLNSALFKTGKNSLSGIMVTKGCTNVL